MARTIDPKLAEILKKYDEGKNAVWDCHGTWVAYHAAVERIAAKAGVTFDPPDIIEADSKAKIVAIRVTGHLADCIEWSFGEAAPGNNKNNYPFAMAEKRAKDRVVLKLVGLHGQVYSEEEADDFKPNERPVEDAEPTESEIKIAQMLKFAAAQALTMDDLQTWWKSDDRKKMFRELPPALRQEVEQAAAAQRHKLEIPPAQPEDL